VKLFYREIGEGEPLIILHGLYGSSDNWMSIAKELSKCFKIFVLDQRNHGQSPHSTEQNYAVMANDLLEFYNDLRIEKAIIIGHSMGGKVAMQFTIDNPEKVVSLVVVDIAPWTHLSESESSHQIIEEHQHIVNALMSIPIKIISSRFEADVILSQWINNSGIRQFLLKNLKREIDGSFSWKFNLPVLAANLYLLIGGINPENTQSNCQTLFIKGDRSNYIPDSRIGEIIKVFPNSRVLSIKNAGHWVHSEKPNEFLAEVLKFLKLEV
jgi:esterase